MQKIETASPPDLKFLFTVAEAAQSAVLESCQTKQISLSKTKVLDLHSGLSIGICSLLNSLSPFVFFQYNPLKMAFGDIMDAL